MKTSFAVAPFEHYMAADDTVRYSMSTNVRFWFDGTFDRAAFDAALRMVLPEHPLFQSFLRGDLAMRTKDLRWEHPGHVTMPYVYWAEEKFETNGRGYQFPDGIQAIDLHQEIGLRLFVREHEGRTELTVTFHHATSDGKGVFNFVEDFLAAYNELKGGVKRAVRSNQDLLRERAFFGLSRKQRLQRLWRDLVVLWKFFTMLPATLFARKPTLAKPRSDIYQVVRRKIPKEQIADVKRAANGVGSTLNDILLRDLFMTLGAWNIAANALNPLARVTIAVPVCMRGSRFQETPSSNYVSMHVLHVPNRVIRDEMRLLYHINKVMKFVKSFEMGHTLVVFATIAGHFPRGLVNFFKIPVSRATAVLTNLGIPFQHSKLRNESGKIAVAGLVMTGVETLPPIRDKTRVAVSINSYDGDLRLTMRYDDTLYDEQTAQSLLDKYVSRIVMTAESIRVPQGVKIEPQSMPQPYPTGPSL